MIRLPRAVLVTGATTSLGAALCRALLDRGVERILCTGNEERADPLPRDPQLRYLRVDLARLRSAHDLLFGPVRELGVEVIVHLASHRAAHHGPGARALDVEALRTILDLAERHPTIRRLVLRSHADVYRLAPGLPSIVTEDHPIDLSPRLPAWRRLRVEADVVATMRMGLSALEIVVLRMAELLAHDVGSQLWDYLRAPVCMVPLGYDPMLNLLSLEDAAHALALAVSSFGLLGAFNIPGADTLPLSRCIGAVGKRPVPIPGPLLGPLYRLRRWVEGSDFSYALNAERFHQAMVLDGTRARSQLGYEPSHGVRWPG